MASVASRKKSVTSPSGLQIDTPLVANNTFLNKAANQSTSLYQQCSQLRARLLRIHDFAPFFAISAPLEQRTSTDPVTQVWDCFALGVPLCFLYNLLPNVSPITSVNTDPATVDPQDEKAVKKAILHFAMAIGNTNLHDHTEQFRATQLLDRSSTEGFVKVVNCVTRLVERLPADRFQEAPPLSPPSLSAQDSTDSLINPDSPRVAAPANAQEAARNNIIREIVETERKYVQDLEHMQKYANALATSSAIDQDTIHLLFPGLKQLLDFQRRLLIKLESSAELPWKEQRWGLHFIENEEEFGVYEPYCANYTDAVEILLTVEQNLMAVTLINTKELPAFLIKPVQRICKYPLLLEQLLKAANNSDYPYYDELKQGLDSAKRVTDRINEAQRRSDNQQTVQSLESRVEDWKGHHLSNFGDLLLDDIFMVTKMDIDREYHVFLFEKIILCCKEVLPTTPGGSTRKGSKSNSMLKKQQMSLPGAGGPPRKKTTPLLLKGRIFLNNVTHTRPIISNGGSYSLQVWWKGDDDNEYFTLRCRSDEQLRQWETQVNRLIKETQARRASERNLSLAAHIHANSTNPRLYDSSRKLSSASSIHYLNGIPFGSGSSSATVRAPPPNIYRDDDSRSYASSVPASSYSSTGAGPSGYPPDDESYEGDEDFEEYPPASQSGRGTPQTTTRRGNAQSMVTEREPVPAGYERPRARTEDQNGPIMRQWRGRSGPVPPPLPPPVGGLPTPAGAVRPHPPRLNSNVSEASFGNGVSQRPMLRSQFSSTRLNSQYDDEGGRASPIRMTPRPMRSRSASQPSAYHPPSQLGPPPPLPSNVPAWMESSKGSISADSSKRGSGSSQSTGDSSEYSPHSASPITPYGSSESSLAGSALRNGSTRRKGAENGSNMVTLPNLVKVKVHFLEDIFVIQVPRGTEYEHLVERVGRKIRLCGPRRDDGPLRVKYIDEDGDQVSIGSTEDVQMAFETMRPGNQITLVVS